MGRWTNEQRKLNIQVDPEHLAGIYANFANVSFSDYEFTITFARIDHEVEEGEIPGVVVSRVNMSQQFTKELLDALTDSWSKYTTVKGIQDLPETAEQLSADPARPVRNARTLAIAIRCISVGWFSSQR